jgi:hypothetical protein
MAGIGDKFWTEAIGGIAAEHKVALGGFHGRSSRSASP